MNNKMVERQQVCSNNDFQATIRRYLNRSNNDSNSQLELQRFADGAIVIKPVGSRGVELDESTEKKEYYQLTNYCGDKNFYLKMTKVQAEIIDWLLSMGMLDDEYDFMPIEKMEIVEF